MGCKMSVFLWVSYVLCIFTVLVFIKYFCYAKVKQGIKTCIFSSCLCAKPINYFDNSVLLLKAIHCLVEKFHGYCHCNLTTGCVPDLSQLRLFSKKDKHVADVGERIKKMIRGPTVQWIIFFMFCKCALLHQRMSWSYNKSFNNQKKCCNAITFIGCRKIQNYKIKFQLDQNESFLGIVKYTKFGFWKFYLILAIELNGSL